jgi:multiple sugar transport system substrate-binding protein
MKAKLLMAFGAAAVTALGVTTILAQGSDPVKVSLWFHSGQGAERDALNTIITRFNAANKDVQMDAVQLPEGSYNDQVNAAALANNLPCVLDFDGPNLYNYAWSQKLIPLDPYVTAAQKADFLPSIIKQGTYNGKLYSLGQFDSGLALWGSRKMLQKAGVTIPTSLATAWTGAQFSAALEKIKKSGVRYPLDMKFNYGAGEWFTYGFAPIMQSFGGDLINRKGFQTAQGVLNGEAAVKGMTYFQNMVRNYVNTGSKADTDFVSGKAALSFVGHWTFSDYSKALKSDLVLIPMPRFGGTRAVTGSGSWNFGISSDCPTPEAAAKVLNALVSTDSVLLMSDASGAVPSRKSSIAKSKNYGPKGALGLYVSQLNNIALERPATPAYPAITKAFSTAADNIAKGANVKAELDKAVRAIDQDIKDNSGYPTK